jgi:hypothetical protein
MQARKHAGLSLLALAAFPLWAATGTTVAVQGTVLDDTGKPLPGAHVLIAAALPATAPHFTAPPVITGPLATTATADASGAFTIPTLAAGQYIACAEAPMPGLLDPCHWATSAPTFTVTAGKTTTGVNITMAKGAVIPIHIDDPQSLLKPVTGPIDFDLQIHAVTAKGHHYNANIQASTATTRDHVITIPFGTAVTIQVLSGHFVVNDQSSEPAAGASVSIPSGASAATMSYVVAGKK